MVAQVVSRRSQLCCVPSPHVTNKGANQRSKDEKRQHEHGAMNELKLTVNTAAPWGDEAAAGPRAERRRPTWPRDARACRDAHPTLPHARSARSSQQPCGGSSGGSGVAAACGGAERGLGGERAHF